MSMSAHPLFHSDDKVRFPTGIAERLRQDDVHCLTVTYTTSMILQQALYILACSKERYIRKTSSDFLRINATDSGTQQHILLLRGINRLGFLSRKQNRT